MTHAEGSAPRAKARTVQVHLPGGDPRGVRVVSRAGWDGYLLVVPRSCIDAVSELAEEMERVGTVVLCGAAETGGVRVRVAHANPVAAQLALFRADRCWTHMYVLGRERDFSRVVARQVALRLIDAARSKRVAEVVDTYPQPPKAVVDAVRRDADSYTAEMVVFLALSGLDIFDAAGTTATDTDTEMEQAPEKTPPAATDAVPPAAPRPSRSAAPGRTRSVDPQPIRGGSEPVVEKASYDEDMQLLLRLRHLTAGQQLRFPQPRKGLVHKATVEPDGALRFLGKRYSSPSGAAGAASGTSTNGWTAWHTTDGRALDDLRRTARKRPGRR